MRRFTSLLFTLFFTLAFAQPSPSTSDRDAKLKAAYGRLDAYIAEVMRATGIPGLSLALTDRNGLLRATYYGYADTKLKTPVTADTEFEIGSISKSFTSISLLQLEDQGKFDPHQPITKYLPWFSIHSKYAPLTGHDVMTHTAGLLRDRDDIPSSKYQAAEVRDRWAGYEPGKHYAYSNVGYQIMGYLLEEITGKPSAENVQERILRPLGMTHSQSEFTHDTYSRLAVGYAPLYDDRPHYSGTPLVEATWLEYAAGDGAIVSTASDMASYVRMLLNRGMGPNGRILSEERFRELTQHGVVTDDEGSAWYGYGLVTTNRDGHTYLTHDGGMVGYSSRILADMDNGVGVAALVNWPGGSDGITGYAIKLLSAVYAGKDLPPVPSVTNPAVIDNAGQYAGNYASPNGQTMNFTAQGQSLLLNRNARAIALERRDTDEFVTSDPEFNLFPIRFVRDKGKIVEVVHGPDWFAASGYTGPRSFNTPPEWTSYVGHYRSNQAWFNNFRIVVRKDKLLLIAADGGEWLMMPDGNGGFWAGEEGIPPREQVSFDTPVHGKTLRCILSGQAYYRTFTP